LDKDIQPKNFIYKKLILNVMTLDVCPLLFKDTDSDVCLGCKIKESGKSKREQRATINRCLEEIKNEIKVHEKSPKKNQMLLLQLYKLKRVTTLEEEDQKLDIAIKKKAMEVLNQIKRQKTQMDKKREVQFSLDVGDVLFNLGLYRQALSDFDKISRSAPKEKRVYNNIGVSMVRQGKEKEALAYYDKALALDPKYGSAWFNKGKALFKIGKKKEALECFKKATKFSPENKSAWNNLGVTLRHLKKFRESIKCYDQAIKIHSDYPWAWHNKGVALMELKRYKDAMRCFDKALIIDPSYEPAKESKREVMRKVI
jgi:tetratricopeptide (TPR) repeat protein